jgi:hypothetical protein
MSKIAVIFEASDFTQKNYDDIMAELGVGSEQVIASRPSHAAFQKGDKWCVVDVWNSTEAFMEFGQNTLFPIFAKLGLTPPQPQIFPLHNYIGAKVEEMVSA